MNYLASVVQLMDICESELLFDTLPIAKAQCDYVKRVWMKNSIVEKRVDKYGSISYCVNNKCHRTDGKPAVVYNGGKYWYVNDNFHNAQGPAIYHTNNEINYWCINGKTHRVGGPAIIKSDGLREWFINGRRHLTSSPAINGFNCNQDWFINGRRHRIVGPAVVRLNGHLEWWNSGNPSHIDGVIIKHRKHRKR